MYSSHDVLVRTQVIGRVLFPTSNYNKWGVDVAILITT